MKPKQTECNVDPLLNSSSGIGEPQVQLRLHCGPGDTYETGGCVGQLGADVAVWLLLSHYGNTCSLLYSAEVVNLSAELQCCHIRECAPLIFCLG